MITGAKSILLSFSVSDINNLMLDEVTEAMDYIQRHSTYTDEDGNTHSADIIWGASEKSTLADDELELVVVATGFADGNDLKISTEYVRDPFGGDGTPVPEPVVEPVVEPQKPIVKLPQPPVPEVVTIMPSQDRYKQIVSQKSVPAYKSRKFAMYAGNESSTKTVYREAPAQTEAKPVQSTGGLFVEE
jgi:cell division protein FtsZ